MNDSGPAQVTESVGNSIRDMMLALKGISTDLAHLFALEARLFGYTALTMFGLAVLIALLLVSSLLFIEVALVTALISLQAFSLTGALVTVALTNLALAILAYWRLRYITRDLTFRESRAGVNSLLTQNPSRADEADQ